MRRVGKGFLGVETPLFEGMLAVGQPAEEGLAAEQVQVDDDAAAAVEEHVAEDVSHDAILSPPPHDAEFPTQLQQVLNICSTLSKCVEKLENDNAAQKLVGASRRVESSADMEDVFNQRRMIDDIDMDEGIELVKDAEVAESEGRHAAQQ
nr:hypothetical protein [Tanacetum cinerariifolium]